MVDKDSVEKRLRDWLDAAEHWPGKGPRGLAREAADEIARLRAALEGIANMPPFHSLASAINAAKRALAKD